MGIEITENPGKLTVNGKGGKFEPINAEFNVGDAGTAARFLTALCCIIPGEITLTGSERMYKRPIKGLVDSLIQLGAHISYLNTEGFLPLKIRGGHIKGGKVNLDASLSSQFLSALLMVTPVLSKDTEIEITGEKVSLPYIDMTVEVMKQFGVEITGEGYRQYHIKGNRQYKGRAFNIEADSSSASYFFALAAITGSTIRINNLVLASLQGDICFVNLLEQMGCSIASDEKEKFIEVKGSKELMPLNANLSNTPDLAPALAIVAAFAKGASTLTGLGNLAIKESNRLLSISDGLSRMGIKCITGENSLVIYGGIPKGALIKTYNDHRIAMAFAIAGAKVNNICIESPEVVNKSFPGFWEEFKAIGVGALNG
jgi:3-phosphoshikimate 1-carboxyvinyltransferase